MTDSDLELSPPQRPPGAAIRREGYGELAAKLVDLRSVARPQAFSGRDKDWPEWRYKFESAVALLGMDTTMEQACRQDVLPKLAALGPESQVQAKLLFNILVQLMGGRALAVVRACERNHGFEAWRALVREYEPNLVSRRTAMLTALLTPQLGTMATFREALLTWERQVRYFEELQGEALPADVKCASAVGHAPPEARQFLRTNPQDLTQSYSGLRGTLRALASQGTRIWW